jgi:hypothetical protein
MRSFAYTFVSILALFILSSAWSAPAPPPPTPADEIVYEELKGNGTFNALSVGWLIAAESMEGKKLLKVTIIRKLADQPFPSVAGAEEAEFRVSPKKEIVKVVLRKGKFQNSSGGTGEFDEATFELPMPPKRPR